MIKLEEMKGDQSTSREEEATQRVRDALEEHETCGTPYACVCEGWLGGAGEHPRPPAGSTHTDAQPASPQMQTPRHWSVRNPPGQEQLLLNQGQRQPRGRAGFGGCALWPNVGAGAEGGSPLRILGQNELGWFGEVYFGSWDDAKLNGEEKIDEAAMRVCLWLAGL